VIARKPTHRVEAEAEAVKNAINVGRSATSLVPAPIPPVLEALATIVVTVVVVVVVVVETTALLVVVAVVVVKRPGMIDHNFIIINSRTHTTWLTATLAAVSDTFLATVYKVPSVITVPASYELHPLITQLLLTTDSRSRATSVGIAPSPRSVLATTVVLKGLSVPSLPFTEY